MGLNENGSKGEKLDTYSVSKVSRTDPPIDLDC